MAKYTSSNIFHIKTVLKVIFLICENDALLIKGKIKRRKEKKISGVISVAWIIEKYLV